MAATLCGKLLLRQGWLPVTHCVRHGSKAVTRHRKPMHFLKQKLLAVTEYIPPKPTAPKRRVPHVKPSEEESGLAVLLKREVETLFQECKMVAVVHNSALNAQDMMVLKHRLYKHGISVRFYPNQVMRAFLLGSPYSNLQPLILGPTVLMVSKEPRVKEVLQVLRAFPQMVLMGARVENALLSLQGLVEYSKLPTLAAVQGQVVGGLSLHASQTAAALRHHPARLSLLLQRYLTQKGEEGTSAGSDSKAEEEVTSA